MRRRHFVQSLVLAPAAWTLGRYSAPPPAPAAQVGAPVYHNHGRPLDEPPGVIAPETISAIKCDQVGYASAARKLAMITLPTPAAEFTIVPEAGGAAVYRGRLAAPALDPDSGDQVQIADFSPLTAPGRYALAAGGERGRPFAIGADVHRHAYWMASRFYYGQRCGTAVEMGGEFAAYRHAPCHLDAAFHASSGRSGAVHNHGGWHDAGDYGRYVVNGGISTATLFWAAEMFPRSRSVSLALPESGNGIPDLWSEARWNLDWMLTLQDADGGVWHKQTSTHFAPFVMPEDDHLTSYIIGSGAAPYKTSGATGDLTAVAAIAGRLFAAENHAGAREYSRRCLEAARRGWTWLRANPDLRFRNPPGISTGDYGDYLLNDEALWAAAELWRATGDAEAHAYFLAHHQPFVEQLARGPLPSWGNVAPLALWSYALAAAGEASAAKPNAMAAGAIRDALMAAAETTAGRAERNGYRIPLQTRDYVWGSNAVLGNYAAQLLVADRIAPRREYRDVARECLHYMLGRNALALGYVTGLGSRGAQRPHHRPSVADGLAAPWPGMLVAGPNPHRNDAAMQKFLAPGGPAAKAYIDNHAAYSCNEVAINWNAPLVFLLAAQV